jgi:hypothetical protein
MVTTLCGPEARLAGGQPTVDFRPALEASCGTREAHKPVPLFADESL